MGHRKMRRVLQTLFQGKVIRAHRRQIKTEERHEKPNGQDMTKEPAKYVRAEIRQTFVLAASAVFCNSPENCLQTRLLVLELH